MNSKEYLDHTFEVSSCDMDVWGFLRPTAILNLCQESAYMHSTTMGFGFEHLKANDLAWVLSRVRVEIERLPVWHEKITVRTWHKRESGLFGVRDYIFFDGEQKPIIKVTSSWLIINRSTRRVMRIDRVFGGADGVYSVSSYAQDALESEAEKIDFAEVGMGLGDHSVRYSDLDVNEHVNNAKYLEWACDYSPRQMERGVQLSGFSLNFNHEAKYPETICLSRGASDNPLTIKGEVEGRNIFVAELRY